MAILVKCPVCKTNKHLATTPKHFFKCCGIAHDVDSNIVIEGYKRNKGDESGKRRNIKGKNSGTGIEGNGIGKDTEGTERESFKIV